MASEPDSEVAMILTKVDAVKSERIQNQLQSQMYKLLKQALGDPHDLQNVTFYKTSAKRFEGFDDLFRGIGKGLRLSKIEVCTDTISYSS